MNAVSSSANESERTADVGRRLEKGGAGRNSDVFLWAAGAAMIASGVIQFLGVRKMRRVAPPLFAIGRRVELLAPMLLMLGVYKRLGRAYGR